MAKGWRPCPAIGCPEPIPPGTRYCPEHIAEYEAKRGPKEQRGYGRAHGKLRARWARELRTGNVQCARCSEPIQPGTEWALDHDDNDRTKYLGPSHKLCNDRAGGQASHR